MATPMSMMPGTSVNAPRGGEGAAREVDGERAPKVKVVLAFRACEVEGERPSLGVASRVFREPHPLTPAGLVVDTSWAPARGGERIDAGSRPVGLGLRFVFHRPAQPDGRGVRARYA